MDKISDEKFKADVMRFIEIANQKFDGLASDGRTNGFKLDRLEAESARIIGDQGKRFDIVETKLQILREQIRMVHVKVDDVASKVMEIDKRLMVIEAKLSLMETKFTSLEDEIRQIRLELDELNETANVRAKTIERLNQIDVRVVQLEERIAA